MPGQTDVFQMEPVDQLGHVVGILVHVVAVPGLVRTAMAAAVMGDNAVAVSAEEHHLGVPGVGRERPAMREQDRLPIAPVLIENLRAVLGGDHAHGVRSFRFAVTTE